MFSYPDLIISSLSNTYFNFELITTSRIISTEIMKHVYHFVSILILTFSLSSCEEENTLDNIQFKSKLVLNSTFTTGVGAVFTAQLSNSKNILNNEDAILDIENASVELFDGSGNSLGELEHIANGRYDLIGFVPTVGVDYTIKASADGFDPIQATSSIPIPIAVNVVGKENVEFEGKSAVKIDVDMYNPDKLELYYVWEVLDDIEPGVTPPFGTESSVAQELILSYTDLNADQILANQNEQSKIFLSSKTEIAEDDLKSTMHALNSKSTGEGELDIQDKALILRSMTVSSDLYEYFKAIEFSRLKGSANSSVTQPLNIYSNIEGGLGIFAGYYQDVKQI